ncbi:MAG TPA: HAMP domain-containing sensor histidine kinase, partial [Polyangiaceae bacterium]|nr:HAMP domain-containing sensor histidine kinase [Polyangiaceae bacterium]
MVDGIDAWLGALPDPTGLGAPRSAMVLPLLHAEGQRAFGFLVVGVSPRLALAGEYRRFLGLAAGAVATAAADARAQHEAKERAEKLAALDRAKTAFFSNVSHEFRTPLTLLLAPVEEALATGETSLSREALAMVHRSGTRLLKLVNTLLDFSRIEAGRAEGVYEPTDLSAYTTNLASAFRSLVEKAGLTLSVDCPPLPEPVWVDREMWEKIVMNLLSNAFKFTLEGEIAVTLERAGRQAQLTVRDTGIGMAAAELPHAFERFHRVAGARGRSHEGTGIGLALVRELVQMHGGTVRVESEVGRGSRFLVSLPLDRGHLAAAAPPRARTLPPTPVRAAAFLDEAAGWLAAPEARDAAEPLALAGAASAGAAPAAAPREARI